MKNASFLLLTCFIFQRSLHAFHKESYYGDPYSMEYVGKFSTVNLTKEDLLFADYVVEMLRNTSYTTIDFNASITYPLRFQQYYETGVPTITTRRFATTSTRSPTKEKKWQFLENEHIFGTRNSWQAVSSISFMSHARNTKSCKVQKNFGFSLGKTRKKNITSPCIKASENKFENVEDIIRRNIIKKPSHRYTESHSLNETTIEREVSLVNMNHTPDCITTRRRRSVPYFLNSDSGPWLTSKEQEQVWALRGTSLLDSEKYDFPFPYDFDKWPGCTTKDLSDPKNTILILEYENGHVRVMGISKPGWNEFPWKPTEFTTAYPAYRRLDKYLTYLSRPWYGYYSTLQPTSLKNWDKKTTQAWSRYTFANLSRRAMYDSKSSKKWIIDKWPPDWNRTIYPQTYGSTWKNTWWGGKWVLSTRSFSKSNAASLTSVPGTSKSNTSMTILYADSTKSNADMTKLSADIINSSLSPHKPTASSLKSTFGFGFLSLSPTWYSSNVTSFLPYNATWISEWSKIWYKASKLALNTTPWKNVWNETSDLSLMGLWSREISLPLYTYINTLSTKSWLDLQQWITEEEVKNRSRTGKFYATKSKQWNRENFNQWNKEKFLEWSTWSQLNRGGWSLPALTKVWTKKWAREQPQPVIWSKTWTTKSYQPYYSKSKQDLAGAQHWSMAWNKNKPYSMSRSFYRKSYSQYPNQHNIVREQQRKWSPWSLQYQKASPWINQWERQQPQTWSRSWFTTKPYQYQPYSKQWNREGSHGWSKPWYTTKLYQSYYSNQRTFRGRGQTLNWRTRPWFSKENSY